MATGLGSLLTFYQKVLAEYGSTNRPPVTGPPPSSGSLPTSTAPAATTYASGSSTSAAAIPSHLLQQHQRTATPPTVPLTTSQPYPYPSTSNGWNNPSNSQVQGYPPSGSNSYNQPQAGYGYPASTAYGTAPPAPAAQPNPDALAATLAAMPDDQKVWNSLLPRITHL